MKDLFLHLWRSSRAFKAAALVIAGVVALEVFGRGTPPAPPPVVPANPAVTATVQAFPGGPQATVTGPSLPGRSATDKIWNGLGNGVDGAGRFAQTGADVAEEFGKSVIRIFDGDKTKTSPTSKSP